MKKSVFSFSAVIMCLCLTIALLYSCADKKISGTAKQEEILAAINNDRWVFYAQHANPQTGNSRFLTSEEYVRFSKDTLDSGLPYFGRAFSGADVMTNQSVLTFKSTNFTISKQKDNKGGWSVMIQPRDYPPVQTYTFTLFDNGSASLTVTLTNRSPISFNGTVAAR